jgi:hypothetical protein
LLHFSREEQSADDATGDQGPFRQEPPARHVLALASEQIRRQGRPDQPTRDCEGWGRAERRDIIDQQAPLTHELCVAKLPAQAIEQVSFSPFDRMGERIPHRLDPSFRSRWTSVGESIDWL